MTSLAHPQLRFTPAVKDPSAPRELVILGSTGSIGTQAIDVVRRNPDRFRVVALSAAGGRVELLAEQALELGVHTVAVADPAAEPRCARRWRRRRPAGRCPPCWRARTRPPSWRRWSATRC